MKRRLWIFASVLVFSGFVPPLGATTARLLSRPDMVKESDLIVMGRVVESRSVWVDRDLVTLATIEVIETLKGARMSRVTVTLPGGVDSNRKFPVAVTWPSAPRLEVREEAVVFLEGDDGGYSVAGFSQGKFSVSTDSDGRKSVSRDLRQLTLRGDSGDAAGSESTEGLASFLADVRRLVAAQRAEVSSPKVK